MMTFLIVILFVLVFALLVCTCVLWSCLNSVVARLKEVERSDKDIEEIRRSFVRTCNRVSKMEKVQICPTELVRTNGRVSKLARVQSDFISHVTEELIKAGVMNR